ncbi:MAG: hypothetical protein KA200_00035 [Burkholderiales bacterium]|nr:hypothetical protein [Burkholderiales bacterium]
MTEPLMSDDELLAAYWGVDRATTPRHVDGLRAVPVLFNPYTGEPRDVRDVQSDPQGILIMPPSAQMLAAAPPPAAPQPLSGDSDSTAERARKRAARTGDAP